MATYLIGDVQGCFDELQRLLSKIQYNPDRDRLGFVGDLINRGPKSLETLRFIKELDDPIIVLGNHDLTLVIMGYNYIKRGKSHCLQEILDAPDKEQLLNWLRQQPLMHYNNELDFCVVHAGIPPQWRIKDALPYANEISTALQANDFHTFLQEMHGDQPAEWQPNLTGWDRLRYLVNAFTRMRFCSQSGKLDLSNKTEHSPNLKHFKPWFEWRQQQTPIIFGHWAALMGKCQANNIYAIDTGCVWGGYLTALRIEDKQLFQVKGKDYRF